MPDLLHFDLELTDTFGGEANYCWVKREALNLPSGSSDLRLVRAAKKALGLSGIRCRRSDFGETIELRPYGACLVAFITPTY